ncbi:hypothetical protein QCD60_24145 [Pokkaliibacter sp. MBI-7]|uniref:phage regulatory CII family protein n=1 Tax=Pokkaliibacter sp. MBI-7 TaxID=3040600 RepID=UPI00244B29FC|nr:phage regulatory CII family protein [Pokkaliibacter sp. MBI-7]MDH2435621.1 hypothetical protein [Pokkaliibacter sp. MBI-7]
MSDSFDRLEREVLPLPEALRLVARSEAYCRGGITGFAYATGRNPTTLSHKFDPAHTHHVLNLVEVMDFLRYVEPKGRAIVLDALHAELGNTLWFEVARLEFEEVPANLVASASELLRTAADTVEATAQHIEDGEISASELAATQKLSNRLIRAAVGLYQRARLVHLQGKGGHSHG